MRSLELLFSKFENIAFKIRKHLFSNEIKALVKKRALEYNKFTPFIMENGGGASFPHSMQNAERKKMKSYRKKELFTHNLRTGLFIVCLLFVTGMLTSCGTEDKLLSELRQENSRESYDPGAAEDSEETIEQGNSIKEILGSMPSVEEIWKNEQDDSVGNFQGAEQNVGTLKREVLSETEKICVHVCGAVKSPGVYKLPAGSRFYEAVEAAGGFTEEACQDYLNMAEPLADGSRLEIPTLDVAQSREEHSYYTLSEKNVSTAERENAESTSDGLVNINTADIAELCNLPGIGEGRAKAIIEYRQKQGSFQKKEDIMQVSGIGEKMYAKMEEYLRVE